MTRRIIGLEMKRQAGTLAARIRQGGKIHEIAHEAGINIKGFSRHLLSNPALAAALKERIEARLVEKPSLTVNKLADELGWAWTPTERFLQAQGILFGEALWHQYVSRNRATQSNYQLAQNLGIDRKVVKRLVDQLGGSVHGEQEALHARHEFQQALRKLTITRPQWTKEQVAEALRARFPETRVFTVKRGKTIATAQVKEALNARPQNRPWSRTELSNLTFLWGHAANDKWLDRAHKFHQHGMLDHLFNPQVPTPLEESQIRERLTAQLRKGKKRRSSLADLTVADLIEAIPDHFFFTRKKHGLKPEAARKQILTGVTNRPARRYYRNWSDRQVRERFARELMDEFRQPSRIPIPRVHKALAGHYGTRTQLEALAELLTEFGHLTGPEKIRFLARRGRDRLISILLQHLDPNSAQARYRELTGLGTGVLSQGFRRLHRELSSGFQEVENGSIALADLADRYGVGARGLNALYGDYHERGGLRLWTPKGPAQPVFREDMVPWAQLADRAKNHLDAMFAAVPGRRQQAHATVRAPADLERLARHVNSVLQRPHAKATGSNLDAARALAEQLGANPPAITISYPRGRTVIQRSLRPDDFRKLADTLVHMTEEHRFQRM